MKEKRPNENAIRDFLAKRLQLIEPGLTLVDREHYLKNAQGAAGFLDIFARDARDRLVIIELKRTDAAAREAIQELFKYVALIREKYLVREVEYRLVLLAVEWRELAIPYSEFVKTAPFEVSAAKIVLDDDGWPARVEWFNPRRGTFWSLPDFRRGSLRLRTIARHVVRSTSCHCNEQISSCRIAVATANFNIRPTGIVCLGLLSWYAMMRSSSSCDGRRSRSCLLPMSPSRRSATRASMTCSVRTSIP